MNDAGVPGVQEEHARLGDGVAVLLGQRFSGSDEFLDRFRRGDTGFVKHRLVGDQLEGVDLGRISPELVVVGGAADGPFRVGGGDVGDRVIGRGGKELAVGELRQPEIVEVVEIGGVAAELTRGDPGEELGERDRFVDHLDTGIRLHVLGKDGVHCILLLLGAPVGEDAESDLVLRAGERWTPNREGG